jgi:hypothetical protein
MTVNMPLKKGGSGDWLLEGNSALTTAQKTSTPPKK